MDFVRNYDGSLKEPLVMPTRLPNLLVNGSSGIAVGMATNIPPHSLDEVCDACLATLNNPDISLEELMEICRGRTFPPAVLSTGPRYQRGLPHRPGPLSVTGQDRAEASGREA